MKAAFIRWNGQKNGQERKATLRAGAKGTGRVLQTVNYWPHSGSSIEAADRIFANVAQDEGYKIVGSDRDEE